MFDKFGAVPGTDIPRMLDIGQCNAKLTVVLTCWDELSNTTTPKEELKKILPLLLNFIEANWIETKVNILGLSSQGGSLKDPELKNKYQEEGSENFGYMLMTDGTKEKDITQLIIEAVQ